MKITSQFFLRCLSLCYLVQFVSLLSQWRGLQSITVSSHPLNDTDVPSIVQSLILFGKALGLDSITYGEFVLVIGAMIAVLGCCAWIYAYPLLRIGIFITLFLIHQLLYTVGDLFLHFQWDILLNETGWIGILLSCMCNLSDHSTLYLIRYLSFKLLLSSGITKLTAECGNPPNGNQWLTLTANEVHFASQCIPSYFAWFFHNLPPGFHRLSVAITLWLETFGTLPLLLPRSYFPWLTYYGAVGHIYFQFLIILTGNYNYFNFLTILLCLMSLRSTRTDNPFSWLKRPDRVWFTYLEYVGGILYVTVSWLWMFLYPYFRQPSTILTDFTTNEDSYFPDPVWQFPLTLSVNPILTNKLSRNEFLVSLYPYLLTLVNAGFLMNIAIDLYNCVRSAYRQIFLHLFVSGLRLRVIVTTTYYIGFLCLIFTFVIGTAVSSTFVFFASIHQPLAHKLPSVSLQIYEYTAPYHITNGYGLFRCMTGVGPIGKDKQGYPLITTARPEIIVEGYWSRIDPSTFGSSSDYTIVEYSNGKHKLTNDETSSKNNGNNEVDYLRTDNNNDNGAWIELPWLYKPGDIYRMPFFNFPHQPRLDWQMWFAALAPNYQHSPWLVHLLTLLLEGSPSVMGLLDTASWPQQLIHVKTNQTFLIPPSMIRAKLYRYDFTRMERIAWGEYRHHYSNSTGGSAKLYRNTVPEPRPSASSPLLTPTHPLFSAFHSNPLTRKIMQTVTKESGRTSTFSSLSNGKSSPYVPWWRRELTEPNFFPSIQQGEALQTQSSLYQVLQRFGWETSVPQIHREYTVRSIDNRTSIEKYKNLDCSILGVRSAKYFVQQGYGSIRETMIEYWANQGIMISADKRQQQKQQAENTEHSSSTYTWANVLFGILTSVPRYLNYVWYTILGLLSDRNGTIHQIQNDAVDMFIPPLSHLTCTSINTLRGIGLLPQRGFQTSITIDSLRTVGGSRTFKAVQVPWWGGNYYDSYESGWWIIVFIICLWILG